MSQLDHMSEPPRVSVVMAVYNNRPFLDEAVESVLNQTYTDFEFIIIDDGSTDGSTKRLQQYAATDERIRLTVQANEGLTVSLNRGLAAAQGAYIARMDGDDICSPNRFAQQVRYLDRHADHVLVGGQVLLIDEKGATVRDSVVPPSDPNTGRMRRLKLRHEDIEESLLNQQWPLVHPAVMMRREALYAIDGYDERYVTKQDADLFLRLAEVGELANLNTVVLEYRLHENQVTAQIEGQDTLWQIRRRAHRRRGLPIPHELTRRGAFQRKVRTALKDHGWLERVQQVRRLLRGLL